MGCLAVNALYMLMGDGFCTSRPRRPLSSNAIRHEGKTLVWQNDAAHVFVFSTKTWTYTDGVSG